MTGAPSTPTMHPLAGTHESRRLLDKLIREIHRTEVQALEHPVREARRLGEVPPVDALRDVAVHAAVMRGRFEDVVSGHGLALHRASLGTTLTSLRHRVAERLIDAERSFRTALLDLRHGLDVVKLLREVARREVLFGLIRWCDDWLGARRALVARVEAQLAWFASQASGAASLGVARGPSADAAADRRESLASVAEATADPRGEP